jgi:hypothetical protein
MFQESRAGPDSVEKGIILPPAKIQTLAIQPIARCYTDS